MGFFTKLLGGSEKPKPFGGGFDPAVKPFIERGLFATAAFLPASAIRPGLDLMRLTSSSSFLTAYFFIPIRVVPLHFVRSVPSSTYLSVPLPSLQAYRYTTPFRKASCFLLRSG